MVKLLHPEEERELCRKLRLGYSIEPPRASVIPFGVKRDWKFLLPAAVPFPAEIVAGAPDIRRRLTKIVDFSFAGIGADRDTLGPFYQPMLLRRLTYFHTSDTDFDQKVVVYVCYGENPDAIVAYDEDSIFYPETYIRLPKTSRPVGIDVGFLCLKCPFCVMVTWRNEKLGAVEAQISLLLDTL